jgi:hypothetical protein
MEFNNSIFGTRHNGYTAIKEIPKNTEEKNIKKIDQVVVVILKDYDNFINNIEKHILKKVIRLSKKQVNDYSKINKKLIENIDKKQKFYLQYCINRLESKKKI